MPIFNSPFSMVNSLLGPILDKELRVSSRRWRNYVLRFVYVASMAVILGILLADVPPIGGAGNGMQTAQMADVGRRIVRYILVFQFFAAQVIAVVSLSTAISDEILHRTLGVLMTTPITGLQIVAGKWISRLLQVVLLLAISLPVLAILRVFGGVPWSLVLSGLCVTLTAVMFAGAMSLLFSVSDRRAFVVIFRTVFGLGIVFGFLPVLIQALLLWLWWGHSYVQVRGYANPKMIELILQHMNPLVAMSGLLEGQWPMRFGPMVSGKGFSLPLHCAIMLTGTGILLMWASRIVRRVALAQACGQGDRPAKGLSRWIDRKVGEDQGQIRSVTDPPLMWKELSVPLIRGGKKPAAIGLTVAVVVQVILYLINWRQHILDNDYVQDAYVLVFLILGMLTHIVLAATVITVEKESHTWPILLSTTLADGTILMGKAMGVLRRGAAVWVMLAGHLILFIAIGFLDPVILFHFTVLLGGMLGLTLGSGLYFGARLRRTTSAVVWNMGLALILWLVVPIFSATFRRYLGPLAGWVVGSPFVQVHTLVGGATPSHAMAGSDHLRYNWGRMEMGLGIVTLMILAKAAIYLGIGLLLALAAKARLRKETM